ncbi:TPA: HEPN domain-containing protein, partial [Candidatus Bathyarchaeota archaeon]|nr:HEPN domain-containing protein [Candidatus Bathyarchaeota archaeon]
MLIKTFRWSADTCRLDRRAKRMIFIAKIFHTKEHYERLIDPKRKRKELRRQVAEWMKRAEHDLSVGEDLAKRSWYPDACFFAQQAAEKALKAFLRSRGAVIRGHRIEDLLEHSARCGLP